MVKIKQIILQIYNIYKIVLCDAYENMNHGFIILNAMFLADLLPCKSLWKM